MQPVVTGAQLILHFEAECLGSCLPAFSPVHLHAAGTCMVCRNQLVPPRIALDRPIPQAERTSVKAKVQHAFAAGGVGGSHQSGTGRAPGLADNSSFPSLPPICILVPKTEESHESNQTPSDRLEKSINMHPPQHVASPLPHTPLTCLSHPWQAEWEQRSRGGRQRLPPKRREAGAGDKAHSPAAMDVRNAPAHPIVWGPLCSSTPMVPNHRGRYIGSRTETALLKEALMCKKPPALALLYVPVWHMGPHSFCPTGQVGPHCAAPDSPAWPRAGGHRPMRADGPWVCFSALTEHRAAPSRVPPAPLEVCPCNAFGNGEQSPGLAERSMTTALSLRI